MSMVILKFTQCVIFYLFCTHVYVSKQACDTVYMWKSEGDFQVGSFLLARKIEFRR